MKWRAWGRHRRWVDVAAAGVLVLLVLVYHWSLFTPFRARRRSFPAGDFYDQFYFFAFYEHGRLWAGELPLWNPHTFGGHPFLADVQAAVFYPLSLVTMLLSGPGPFSALWLEGEAVLHVLMGAAFVFLFVRRLTRGTGAALIAAVTFAFGGYLTSYPPLQLAILETQVWLPLLLLLLDVGLRERRWEALPGAGLTWGMALLAGHPQSAMYVFYAALGYGLFVVWRAGWRWWKGVVANGLWIVIGGGLAAVHLLPALEFTRLSVRASLPYEELAGGFAWRDFVQFWLPGVYTYWSPMYVGVLPLLLAAVAVAGGMAMHGSLQSVGLQMGEFSQVTMFWGGMAVVGALLSLGGRTFVYRLFYLVVPGFALFRSQERAIYLTSFALAVLAGYGWRWLMEVRRGGRWATWAMALVGVASLVGSLVATLSGGGSWAVRLAVAGVLAVGSGVVVRLAMRWHRVGMALALVLLVGDLWLVNGSKNFVPGGVEAREYDASWLSPMLAEEGVFRVANEWGVPGNLGCRLGWQDLYGASPLRLQAHKVMADALPHWRLWQLFGVRYVLTWEHDLPGPLSARRVAMHGEEWAKNTVYMHRLMTGFPRAWVVHRARQVTDAGALAALADPSFDPFAQVLLAEPVPDGWGAAEEASSSTEVELYTPERIRIRAALSARGWLVVGEWHYPGWQAWVDGVQRRVYRADYGLRAVPLSPGRHVVEFRYRPGSFYLGAAVSALTLVGVVAIWLLTRSGWRKGVAGGEADG